MTTPQDLITVARDVLNDTDATTPRHTDAELLRYFNDGMREVSTLRPDQFLMIGDYTCIVSQSEQFVSFADAQELVAVLSIHGGNALTQFDIPTMDAFKPGWRAATPAAATQWGKFPGDPRRFFIYPPAPGTVQTLDIQYVKIPTVLSIGDTITELPARFFPALQDYIIYRASLKDDEHVNSNRAAGMFSSFVSKVKGATQ